MDVALFGFTDRYVSESNNNFVFDNKNKNNQAGGKIKKVKLSNGQADVVLSIDTEIASGNQFVYKVSSDFTKIEEVTNWEEEL